MKISIELDADTEEHKIIPSIKGNEYRLCLEGLEMEIRILLTEGHPFISADAVLEHLHKKLCADMSYFRLSL